MFSGFDPMKAVQAAAASVVARVLGGRTLDSALVRVQALTAFESHDRALLHELCYGTLRQLAHLRDSLKPLLKRPVEDLQLEMLLCVALYQLRNGRASTHAVVSNAVDAAIVLRLTSARGLVNAVLRGYLRNREAIDARPPSDDEAGYSYPQWWIDAVRAGYPDAWREILGAGNEHPPLTLRVNRRRAGREAALLDLSAAGLNCCPIGDEGIIIDPPRSVGEIPGFAEGVLSVQDHGAQLAAGFLDAHDGMRVLDACAAPGGKTTHILERADCDVTAVERDETRLTRVRDNLSRVGLEARTLQADATDTLRWWDGKPFDRVLADVPCTASGVVRRHPDGKWLRRPTDAEQFAKQQHAILEALWPLVTPGGRLLYTTCSIFPSENDDQVRDFLGRHEDAVRVAIEWPAGLSVHGEGQLLPVTRGTEENHDGFFYALIEKRCG